MDHQHALGLGTLSLITSVLAPCVMQGRIFLDRSGTLFDEVLSLLRDRPEWRPPKDRWRPVGAMRVGWGRGHPTYYLFTWLPHQAPQAI